MRRLCTICARGGSQGLKGKNLRLLAGKPLIAHSIVQALESGIFDTVAVSSDSGAILAAAAEWGVDHLIERPAALASDTAPKIPVIRHCAETVEKRTGRAFDVIMDLDATAPLRNLDDIRGAMALLESSGAAVVVSGMPARRSPYFNLVELTDRGGVKLCCAPKTLITRRQDSPPCFDLNASVFAWTRKKLFSGDDSVFGDDSRLFLMPEDRSIDIDTETDFQFVEFLFSRHEASI